jgi:hypothetical protein
MFLMSLDVCPKQQFAVLTIVHLLSHHNASGTESARDVVVGGKTVEPKNTVVSQLYDEAGWYLTKR